LRKAVEEATRMQFGADAVVAAAEALVAAGFREEAPDLSMASALKTTFEPLRTCFELVKRKVDVARGFDALDAACAGPRRASALELFALRWDRFRGKAQPHGVDPLALALVAQDLARLSELIGGREVEKVEVDVENLPLDLPGRPQGKARSCWTSRQR
jgi:hypothetical protein